MSSSPGPSKGPSQGSAWQSEWVPVFQSSRGPQLGVLTSQMEKPRPRGGVNTGNGTRAPLPGTRLIPLLQPSGICRVSFLPPVGWGVGSLWGT